MGTLTRQEMVDVINRGESVSYAGAIHWTVDTLPSETDMAIGDEARMKVAETSLDDQIATLMNEKRKLAAARQHSDTHDGQRQAREQADADARAAELEAREQALADREEAFRREVAARQSVSDDAAAEAAQQLEKEREQAAKDAAKAAEEAAKSEGGDPPKATDPPKANTTQRGRPSNQGRGR